MTTQELNRDIKRLWKNYQSKEGSEPSNEYYSWLASTIKPELKRLYNADTSMKSLNATSIKILLRLNLSLRVFHLHSFGLFIEI